GMTNAHHTKLNQYEDLESVNAYHELVDQKHIVDGPTMLKYLANMSRDNARTPMQWDSEANAGFSKVTPWYALNTNYKEINAEAELKDDHSVFYYYQKLIKLRHDNEIIRRGTFEELDPKDDQVYAYRRHY
ncbi:alpha-amylase family glycosyl hydrolase, partial [Lentilactobacillus hilgardii]